MVFVVLVLLNQFICGSLLEFRVHYDVDIGHILFVSENYRHVLIQLNLIESYNFERSGLSDSHFVCLLNYSIEHRGIVCVL